MSNNSGGAIKGGTYTTTITADVDFTLTNADVSVKMGGIDITSTSYNNGTITISNISGDIDISVRAKAGKSGCIIFGSKSPFKIIQGLNGWDGSIEYSTNGTDWSTWSGADISSGTVSGANRIYLRGISNTLITGGTTGTNNHFIFNSQDKVYCQGNIENLLDYSTVALGNHPPMASGCFSGLFAYCTKLIDVLELPAVTLVQYCYTNMFYGCTSLVNLPSLPATSLKNYCYQSMFQNCTGLTTAPALPATTLATYCYFDMFYNCSKIKLSTTKTGEYQTAYRIPTRGTISSTPSSAFYNMFYNTRGTFTGSPTINTTYYTSNTIIS